jgi:hypothetical protein
MAMLDILKGLFGAKDSDLQTGAETVNSNLTDDQSRKTPLTREEAEEHSWDFLHDITEKVEHEFPEKDTDAIVNVGKNMDKIGIIYYHVVNRSQK